MSPYVQRSQDDDQDPYANPPREPRPPRRSAGEPWWKSRVLIGIVALAVGAGIGIGVKTQDVDHAAKNSAEVDAALSPTPTPSASSSATGIVIGALDLTGEGNFTKSGKSCTGAMGYDDIKPGAEVDVSNGSGETIAFADLGNGIVTDGNCEFVFTFDSIPRGEGIYKVTIGSRPGPSLHESDIESGIALTLGS